MGKRMNKQLSQEERISNFWMSPDDAFFNQETVAAVLCISVKTLTCERAQKGRVSRVPFRKCGGRILYRKSDVVTYLNNCPTVNSTFEYSEKNNGQTE